MMECCIDVLKFQQVVVVEAKDGEDEGGTLPPTLPCTKGGGGGCWGSSQAVGPSAEKAVTGTRPRR